MAAAAAAYAFLVSLLNTMDQIQFHPLLSPCFDYYQFESLRQMVDFFLDFLENYSDAVISKKIDFLTDFVGNFPDADIKEVEDWVRRIADAARKAEDIIEVEAAVRIRAASTQQSRPSFLPDLEHIMQEMDSFNQKILKVKEKTGSINSMASSSSSSSSSWSAPLAAAKTTMVGFDVHLEKLLDKLTGYHSGRLILPIVGMGGIGKTTLARNAYQNLLIVEHFYVRAWITISQEFNARDVLLKALSCLELGGSISKKDSTNDQLGEELYKALSGRRYLIVLDDVWSVEAWEKIRFFFPENNNRSRIVVTTRETDVAAYFGSSAFALDFLDDKYSWDLFCDKTFPQEGCPSALEEIGKKIVTKCKGLPLAILLIGGILRKSPRTREYWEKIRNDKSLVLDSEESNKPLRILYMSYKHLPICLKSCFLYLRVFPEDDGINVPRLVKLWVAEGIIKPKRGHSLEEVAESYIMELVDRNLVLVGDLEINKKPKTCYVHDLVRDLCVRIAGRELPLSFQRDIDGTRLYIVDERAARLFPRQYSDVSERLSIFCPLTFHLKRKVWFDSQLLRVLVCDTVGSDYSLGQVNLRFLSLEFGVVELNTMSIYKLPSSISLLWSLQTLIINIIFTVVAPSEIWEMRQLRHIDIWYVSLPDPPKGNVVVLENLQTLKRAKNLILTEEVCKRIASSIKELSIYYEFHKQGEASWCYYLHNVGCFDKLESLHYSCNGIEYAGNSLQGLKFPSHLKELKLEGCNLEWEMIGSLPHLQLLELLENAVAGPEWNCGEEKFMCLKNLHIDRCGDLTNWIADSDNFPALETLSLWFLRKLEEIPWGFGEIGTLKSLDIYHCNEAATISALKILEEQESLGNEDLQLHLCFFHETDAEKWRFKIQELGITCQNLRIDSVDDMTGLKNASELADMLAESVEIGLVCT